MSEYLFVYGTLRKSLYGRLHPLLCDLAGYIGMASMPGELYEIKNYPGAIAHRAEMAFHVHGEVYQLHDAKRLLQTLDEYEECTEHFPNPHEYRRREKTITLSDQRLLIAWVYLYNRSVAGLERIVHGDYHRYSLTRPAPSPSIPRTN